MEQLKCSRCKKNMQPIIKCRIQNTFYKTCEFCREKQQTLYYIKSKSKEIKDEIKVSPVAIRVQPKKECYICFNEYEKGNIGIPCTQCNKSCCGNCYMKIFISTKGNFKCGLCRFQDYKYQPNFTQKTLAGLVVGHAYICGFDRTKIIECFNAATGKRIT